MTALAVIAQAASNVPPGVLGAAVVGLVAIPLGIAAGRSGGAEAATAKLRRR